MRIENDTKKIRYLRKPKRTKMCYINTLRNAKKQNPKLDLSLKMVRKPKIDFLNAILRH